MDELSNGRCNSTAQQRAVQRDKKHLTYFPSIDGVNHLLRADFSAPRQQRIRSTAMLESTVEAEQPERRDNARQTRSDSLRFFARSKRASAESGRTAVERVQRLFAQEHGAVGAPILRFSYTLAAVCSRAEARSDDYIGSNVVNRTAARSCRLLAGLLRLLKRRRNFSPNLARRCVTCNY